MDPRLSWLAWTTIVVAIVLAAAAVAMSLSTKEALGQDNANVSDAEKPVSSADVARRQQSPETIRDYWTQERMRNAKPPDIAIPGSPNESAKPPSPQGPSTRIPPAPSAGTSGTESSSAEVQPTATTTDGYTYPFPFSRYEVFASYTAPQYKTNGKIFFTENGSNFVCSGTVVNTTNKSVVWTAGHCVHGGAGGAFHTNWQFVPAYKDGAAPLGRWTARELWTLNGWSVNDSFRYDLGAAIVNPDANGLKLAARTGAKGITFNVSSVRAWHDFGYPQASPFNGNRMNVCASSYAESDAPDTVSGDNTIGIGCDMTGGSSGGGWILSFAQTGGFVNSVNSYKYDAEPLSIYGPFHGTAAKNLYDSVKAR